MIASLLETNSNEALEFFDKKIMIYGFLIATFFIIFYQLNKPIKASQAQYKFFKYFSILLIVFFTVSIAKDYKKHNNFTLRSSELLYIFPHTNNQYDFYKKTKQELQNLSGHQKNWVVTDSHQNYQNYVLIIGESASKNYLSAYGYPVQTSPFLNRVNGIKYTNMIAPAPYTTQSVPRLLSIPNQDKVEFYNNIVALANQVGMNTYWVSNQDKSDIADNEIHYIANNSKKTHYLSEIAPTSKRFDYQLLPIIKNILEQDHHHKLIIVHLMGSHPKFHKRVDFNKAHFKFDNDYLSDYLSSLLQTDMLIEELYSDLKNSNEPFSIVYTSDHALTPTALKHGISQFSLQTPLFKISSDDNTQKTNDDIISGFGFVWFLTEWLNINTDNQQKNNFLTHYKVDSLNDVKFFDNAAKPYLSAPAFNGELLKPNNDELEGK
ncbi:phosphoethanolamine transferase [Moraxella oblonga]|uniref:phosphoethanolamine transferase n=1 Tax=Moraxella oblonga TaxID=200413 RepID=UPI001FDF9074|nr:phosphoethanolamine transferase [Moraxella oblonga]